MVETSHFSIAELSPCPTVCIAGLSKLCPNCGCVDTSQSGPSTASTSSERRILSPPSRLNRPFGLFIEALRTRLLDDIVQQCDDFRRLGPGVILAANALPDEWTTSWDSDSSNLYVRLTFSSSDRTDSWYQPHASSVAHCQLHLRLTLNHIRIDPVTQSLPLRLIAPSDPPPAKTRVILLPLGTPAFYLHPFTEPTDALDEAFTLSLHGLGAGRWRSNEQETSYSAVRLLFQDAHDGQKGLLVVWPTQLLLRAPDLIEQGHLASSLPSPTAMPATDQASQIWSDPDPQASAAVNVEASAGWLPAAKADISETTSSAAHYIEAIARLREQERERSRKEREDASESTSVLPNGHSETSTSPHHPIHDILSLPQEVHPAIISPEPPPVTVVNSFATDTDEPPPTPLFSPVSEAAEDAPDIEDVDAGLDADDVEFPPFTAWHSGFNGSVNQVSNTATDGAFPLPDDFRVSPSVINGRDGVVFGPRAGVTFEDAAITEDDYDFFDEPSNPAGKTDRFSLGVPSHEEAMLAQLSSTTGAPYQDGHMAVSSMQAFQDVTMHGDDHWIGASADAFPWVTHGMLDNFLFPSPGPTPEVLQTNADVATEPRGFVSVQENGLRPAYSPFDSIRFGVTHEASDTKYTAGKFTLAMQPRVNLPISSDQAGWKPSYDAGTDPKFNTVKKLALQRHPSSGARNTFIDQHWDGDNLLDADETTPPFTSEDAESASEGDSDLGNNCDYNPSNPLDTSSTFDHLPLGPEMLHAHFYYSHVTAHPQLPHSRPETQDNWPTADFMRGSASPGDSIGKNGETLGSPNPVLSYLAQEAVENPVWYESLVRGGAKCHTLQSLIPQSTANAIETRLLHAFQCLQFGSVPEEHAGEY